MGASASVEWDGTEDFDNKIEKKLNAIFNEELKDDQKITVEWVEADSTYEILLNDVKVNAETLKDWKGDADHQSIIEDGTLTKSEWIDLNEDAWLSQEWEGLPHWAWLCIFGAVLLVLVGLVCLCYKKAAANRTNNGIQWPGDHTSKTSASASRFLSGRCGMCSR